MAGCSPRRATRGLTLSHTNSTYTGVVLLCPSLQGGPYHDMLHSILGAYTCYRPDVGYVSEAFLNPVICLPAQALRSRA